MWAKLCGWLPAVLEHLAETKRMCPHVWRYEGRVHPMGSRFQRVSWDAMNLWGDFPIRIDSGASVGVTNIGFGLERVPGPHPVM